MHIILISGYQSELFKEFNSVMKIIKQYPEVTSSYTVLKRRDKTGFLVPAGSRGIARNTARWRTEY